MRSLFLLIVALFLVSSNAESRRLRNDNGDKKKRVRGVGANYVGLASEVDIEVQNRVQRRYLMEDKNEDKNSVVDAVEMAASKDGGEDDMSMSLSMSM
jgi:hypothetical protein